MPAGRGGGGDRLHDELAGDKEDVRGLRARAAAAAEPGSGVPREGRGHGRGLQGRAPRRPRAGRGAAEGVREGEVRGGRGGARRAPRPGQAAPAAPAGGGGAPRRRRRFVCGVRRCGVRGVREVQRQLQGVRRGERGRDPVREL